jgi:hypothetical protein
LLDVLEQLAKFELVKGLTHNGSFQSLFVTQLFTPSGKSMAGEVARITTGDQVIFKVQNVSSWTLYIHIYDIGPLSQIQNIVQGKYYILPPRKPLKGYSGILRTKLRIKLPLNLE